MKKRTCACFVFLLLLTLGGCQNALQNILPTEPPTSAPITATAEAPTDPFISAEGFWASFDADGKFVDGYLLSLNTPDTSAFFPADGIPVQMQDTQLDDLTLHYSLPKENSGKLETHTYNFRADGANAFILIGWDELYFKDVEIRYVRQKEITSNPDVAGDYFITDLNGAVTEYQKGEPIEPATAAAVQSEEQ